MVFSKVGGMGEKGSPAGAMLKWVSVSSQTMSELQKVFLVRKHIMLPATCKWEVQGLSWAGCVDTALSV